MFRSNEKSSNSRTTSDLKNEFSSTEGTFEEDWKGALNVIQPQPVYAFPIGNLFFFIKKKLISKMMGMIYFHPLKNIRKKLYLFLCISGNGRN